MAPTVPQPGQVIRYAYLGWNEARLGREDGSKDRPCAVILTRIDKAGQSIAYVLPMTHTPPLVLAQVKHHAREKQLTNIERTE